VRDFFQAAIPEPVTLLGQQLHPFSIGHWILLERFDCSYITGGAATIPDLMLGVLICCNRYEEFISLARNESIFQLTKKWTKRIGNFDFPEKSKSFSGYIDDSIKNLPKYWVEEKKSGTPRKAGAPYIQTLRAFLLSKTSLSNADIMNQPFALSVWDMTTVLELEGALRINSKADDEAEEQAKAFEKYFDGLTDKQKTAMRGGQPVNN
jgi:hypothetical protein